MSISREIVVKTNWLFPLVIIILIVLVVVLLKKTSKVNITLRKRVTFVKAKGGKIGNSIFEEDKIEQVEKIYQLAKANNVNLYLPTDSVNADKFENSAIIQNSKINAVPDGYMGLDIGNESIKIFADVINSSKTILWNGPVGVFEMDKFETGTKELALEVVKATEKGAFSLIGGGDSVAALTKFGLNSKVSYISTGGGALLEYIEGKELPGIKAILQK